MSIDTTKGDRSMTKTRYITLPAINKQVPLGAYVKAVKTAKANPTVMFKTGLTTWWASSGAEIVQQFRAGMMERINQGVSYNERGM